MKTSRDEVDGTATEQQRPFKQQRGDDSDDNSAPQTASASSQLYAAAMAAAERGITVGQLVQLHKQYSTASDSAVVHLQSALRMWCSSRFPHLSPRSRARDDVMMADLLPHAGRYFERLVQQVANQEMARDTALHHIRALKACLTERQMLLELFHPAVDYAQVLQQLAAAKATLNAMARDKKSKERQRWQQRRVGRTTTPGAAAAGEPLAAAHASSSTGSALQAALPQLPANTTASGWQQQQEQQQPLPGQLQAYTQHPFSSLPGTDAHSQFDSSIMQAGAIAAGRIPHSLSWAPYGHWQATAPAGSTAAAAMWAAHWQHINSMAAAQPPTELAANPSTTVSDQPTAPKQAALPLAHPASSNNNSRATPAGLKSLQPGLLRLSNSSNTINADSPTADAQQQQQQQASSTCNTPAASPAHTAACGAGGVGSDAAEGGVPPADQNAACLGGVADAGGGSTTAARLVQSLQQDVHDADAVQGQEEAAAAAPAEVEQHGDQQQHQEQPQRPCNLPDFRQRLAEMQDIHQQQDQQQDQQKQQQDCKRPFFTSSAAAFLQWQQQQQLTTSGQLSETTNPAGCKSVPEASPPAAAEDASAFVSAHRAVVGPTGPAVGGGDGGGAAGVGGVSTAEVARVSQHISSSFTAAQSPARHGGCARHCMGLLQSPVAPHNNTAAVAATADAPPWDSPVRRDSSLAASIVSAATEGATGSLSGRGMSVWAPAGQQGPGQEQQQQLSGGDAVPSCELQDAMQGLEQMRADLQGFKALWGL